MEVKNLYSAVAGEYLHKNDLVVIVDGVARKATFCQNNRTTRNYREVECFSVLASTNKDCEVALSGKDTIFYISNE